MELANLIMKPLPSTDVWYLPIRCGSQENAIKAFKSHQVPVDILETGCVLVNSNSLTNGYSIEPKFTECLPNARHSPRYQTLDPNT